MGLKGEFCDANSLNFALDLLLSPLENPDDTLCAGSGRPWENSSD